MARPKTDQLAEGVVLYLGPVAVIDPTAKVFNLSADRISRRIKAATRMASLGEGFSGHSPRVGKVQDLSAAGGVDYRGQVGQSDDAGQVY